MTKNTAETILNSSFDWNGIRQPFTVATENDSLNGVAMLFGHMLTGTAQIFADVRTFWSPESVDRVTGQKLTGQAENGVIHLINSSSATLDGTCCQKNVDEKAIYRPSAWSAHGMDLEGSDYRACQNYGPLYKK